MSVGWRRETLGNEPASITVQHLVADKPGPAVALIGGIHGDELEGVAAVRMLVRQLAASLERGSVRAVDVANPPAFAARTRTSPLDDANLARIFPGSIDGSPSDKIARLVVDNVIDGSDVLVDLHSAGVEYAMPWFVGYVATQDDAGARAAALARVFAAPLVWAHDAVNPGRTLTVAAERLIPALYVEGTGGSALRAREVHGYVDGVLRVLRFLGMIDDAPDAAGPSTLLVGGAGDVDASVSCRGAGWCMTIASPGDTVRSGDPLAEVIDTSGEIVETITAPVDGTVMLIRRRAEVAPGTAIAMLGPVPP